MGAALGQQLCVPPPFTQLKDQRATFGASSTLLCIELRSLVMGLPPAIPEGYQCSIISYKLHTAQAKPWAVCKSSTVLSQRTCCPRLRGPRSPSKEKCDKVRSWAVLCHFLVSSLGKSLLCRQDSWTLNLDSETQGVIK